MEDQRLLFAGAGEAAVGIADLTAAALVAQGMTMTAARAHCWLLDSQGLVVAGRANVAPHKQPYAHTHPPIPDLLRRQGSG